MTAQTQNSELQKVESAVIQDDAGRYLKLLQDAETIQAKYDALQEHVKTSMEHSLKRATAYEVQQAIMRRHLAKMLDEHEAIFNRTGKFESVEFASDYIEAATAAKHTGRKDDLIKEVTEWMNSESSLPFNNTCRVAKQYPVNP